MKILVFSLVLLLAIGVASSTNALSYAQMPEHVQQKMTEQGTKNMSDQKEQVLDNLENFGIEVSNFVREAMSVFQEQRQETISQIKQCREDMANAELSERSQIKQDCRSSLDEIKDSYKGIRTIFQETFMEYRDSIEVLRADAKDQQVSDSEIQAAIDDIKETAKSRHLEMQGNNGMNIEELREKMRSVHKGQQ